jgi:thiamine-phosphate pyrophosphorylase
MLIVISDSDFKPGEASIINELFHSGLDLFHIRKYGASEELLWKLIAQIHPENHSRLVLHHNHEWGKRIGLKRFHYSETDRKMWEAAGWTGINKEFVYSTSVHSLEEHNELPQHFSYAFLSPVFDSISKADYKAVKFDLSKRENNKTELIGLGGIQAENVDQMIRMGFDGAALLGAIWNNSNPINEWNQCRDAMHRVPNKLTF